MTIMKKIAPYVLALGVGASALTGCATTQMANRPAQQTEQKEYATIDEAMEVLGARSPSMIQMNLPDGYKTSIFEDRNLRTLAGIYAGTVEVKRTGNGYTANGSYSQFQHPDAMRRVLKEADTNGDKIITRQESRDLAMRLYEENAK
jgi:hypothetical protein|tara:strand:+ start:171 stop:611 length:441 start_codon:yes stop_codon:yes gene_type:complete